MAGRVMVVWCPDWPVVAAATEEQWDRRSPAAVLATGKVLACNETARNVGVRRDMRRRDAQARCPELLLAEASSDRDVRAFEPVIATVEELRPGVAPVRPGLLALRAPGRFHGGEEHAAALFTEHLVEHGVWDVRSGFADDLFTAQQAARRADVQESVIVPVGGSAAFLGELPVDVLDVFEGGRELVGLLRRLGLQVLGELAGLPAGDVATRFGALGARVHRMVRAETAGAALPTRTPPPELSRSVDFEPPLDSIEAVCFSVRRTAEELVAVVAESQEVCTEVRVVVETDRGTVSERSWAHAGWFRSADLIDRVHWQLQGAAQVGLLDGPVRRVTFHPEVLEPGSAHADGLWGSGTDERVSRGIAKIQAMLGYDAAVRPVLQGGRAPGDRQALVPWGEQAVGLRPRDLPWPGSIPAPAPTRIFPEPKPAALLDEHGRPLRVTDRGVLTGIPVRCRIGADSLVVAAWAGPWPIEELWWSAQPRMVARCQVVATDGRAWLVRYDAAEATWWGEASYE